MMNSDSHEHIEHEELTDTERREMAYRRGFQQGIFALANLDRFLTPEDVWQIAHIAGEMRRMPLKPHIFFMEELERRAKEHFWKEDFKHTARIVLDENKGGEER